MCAGVQIISGLIYSLPVYGWVADLQKSIWFLVSPMFSLVLGSPSAGCKAVSGHALLAIHF